MNRSDEKTDKRAENSFAVKSPSLSLPKGGGAIKGIGEKFTTNPVTGTGKMSVAIAISPGRNGFSPQLALSYDSGAGNGPFGLGWSLDLPAITRKTDKGLPRYDDGNESDVFILSGAEDLVPVPGPDQTVQVYGVQYQIHLYRPRIEGLFARIERWTEVTNPANVFWRSISRDNITTWYGRDAQSRVFDAQHPAHIFQWLVCLSHDDRGNAIEYRYAHDNANELDLRTVWEINRDHSAHNAYRYLSEVCYSHKRPYIPELTATGEWPALADEDWLFRVVFDYGDPQATYDFTRIADVINTMPLQRMDAFSNHRAGFDIRCHRLCGRALMFHNFSQLGSEPTLVRATEFTYGITAGAYTNLKAVTQRSYERDDHSFHHRALPPLEFEYSEAVADPVPQSIPATQLVNLPVGTQGSGYQWIDLDGEGLSGVLSEHQGAWYYKANRGDGYFAPQRMISSLPATAASGAAHQFLDLAGDGEIDVVDFNQPVLGFHERDREQGWTQHIPFAKLPNIDWNNPNLRFIDLSGDGHADAVLTEDEVFTWYPSLSEAGFDDAVSSRYAHDENDGPRIVFAEVEQTIFLADMCGDGLTDIVRIRNGEVCYWPNLGYGRFGRKVTLGNSPRFEAVDLFDSRRIRMADIDGSGPVDIIYLGRDGASLYFNRSGNSLSDPQIVALPVATENLAAVQVADLLGNGTACLVWNSHLPNDAHQPVRYIDLMGGQKPHLLTRIKNNMGAETLIEYRPSTYFYLEDIKAGKPWITRLAFPVHCVSKVTIKDKWRGTSFSSSYSYHHGYFDGTEREFRGFGRVEQIDTEDYGDPKADQAPIKTVTWYHSGVAFDRQRILNQLSHEYFSNRYTDRLHSANAFYERALPEPELPANLNADEWREALRACKGMMLRQESYELDSVDRREVRLYNAATHNCRIQCVQRRAHNRHAVFLVTESESLVYQYELAIPATGPITPDPRVAHTLNLRHDDYGNLLQVITVGYPRWREESDIDLPEPDLIRAVQSELHVACNELRYTDDALMFSPSQVLRHHRLRLSCETKTFELGGINKGDRFYYSPADFARVLLSDYYGPLPDAPPSPANVPLRPYHQPELSSVLHKRLVEHTRSLYFDDGSDTASPAAPLLFGHLGPRGLKYEDYKLALTDGLLDAVFADKLDWPVNAAAACLDVLKDAEQSGYVPGTARGLDGSSDQYWMRSGMAGFAADAHQHFFLPESYTDAFANQTTLTFDSLDLYVQSSVDALGNSSAIERFDFRVLAPVEMIDINGNHTEVAFDILGLPIASAVKGKQHNGQWQGDVLVNLADMGSRNPDSQTVAAFVSNIVMDEGSARNWLADASSRFIYHFGESYGPSGEVTWERSAPSTCTIVREQHQSHTSPLQVSLECSDGSGNVLMKKVQAEPEQPGGSLRWIVNGLTILNNKGKPVKQYEPAFSDHFGWEQPAANGVTSVMHYDAAGRVIRSDAPDGTFSKVEFSPWLIKAFDANDTVLDSEWYRRRTDITHPRYPEFSSSGNQRAASLAANHADTPSLVLLDSLGREVIAIAHNRTPDVNNFWQDERYLTFTRLDAEGKPLWIRDARGNLVMQYVAPYSTDNRTASDNFSPCYDIAGNLLFQHSMDAGDRWTLNDAAGKPMFAWDAYRAVDENTSPVEQRLYMTEYDALHRSTELQLRINDDPAAVIEKFIYQDAVLNAGNNLNGQATHHYDASGLVQNIAMDFKGDMLEVRRQLVIDKEASTTDWQGDLIAKLENETWIQITEYDALKRMTRLFNWHRDVTFDAQGNEQSTPGATNRVAIYVPGYGERGTLRSEMLHVGASKVTVNGIAQAQTAQARSQQAIADITYDAKGQRQSMTLGNGTVTRYTYDSESFRLVRLYTRRAANDADSPLPAGVQNLSYVYDPSGNITDIRDDAQQTVYFRNSVVEPHGSYVYDALYRLVQAQGREQASSNDLPAVPERNWPQIPVPTDRTLREYTQRYIYDSVGNFIAMHHDAGNGTWHRYYRTAADSNRLLQTRMHDDAWNSPDPAKDTHYRYDSHGSMLNIGAQTTDFDLHWDHCDMIRHLWLGGGGDAYYQYDSSKQRTRKYIQRNGSVEEERIYLGGFERYRRTNIGGVVEEIESHHLFDGEQRVLLVDDVIRSDGNAGPNGTTTTANTCWRYQYGNHLGSVALELDEQTRVISYEEFHPYGTSAFRMLNADVKAPARRYRYTGMERDEESGLSYHMARYYMPWLGRWGSCDPIGLAGGMNLFNYGSNNPVIFVDANGTQPDNWELYQQKALRQRVRATVTDRGITAEHRQNAQILGKQWGVVDEIQVGHVKPFGITRAGEVGDTYAQPRRENASQGTADKAVKAQAKARGNFAREGDIDATVPKGTSFGPRPPINPALQGLTPNPKALPTPTSGREVTFSVDIPNTSGQPSQLDLNLRGPTLSTKPTVTLATEPIQSSLDFKAPVASISNKTSVIASQIEMDLKPPKLMTETGNSINVKSKSAVPTRANTKRATSGSLGRGVNVAAIWLANPWVQRTILKLIDRAFPEETGLYDWMDPDLRWQMESVDSQVKQKEFPLLPERADELKKKFLDIQRSRNELRGMTAMKG